MIVIPISENIKKLREIYNLSQKELGEIAGVTDKAVSTWELGTKEPRMGAIQRIADYFHLQKSNIIEDDGMTTVFSGEVSSNSLTTADANEKDLLNTYRELTSDNQAYMRIRAKELLSIQVAENELSTTKKNQGFAG